VRDAKDQGDLKENEHGATTVIVKHAEDYVKNYPHRLCTGARLSVEHSILNVLPSLMTATSGKVFAPRTYGYYADTCTIVIEDLGPLISLRSFLQGGGTNVEHDRQMANALGCEFGRYLASLHTISVESTCQASGLDESSFKFARQIFWGVYFNYRDLVTNLDRFNLTYDPATLAMLSTFIDYKGQTST